WHKRIRLWPSARGLGAFGEVGHLCFSTHSARLLASRTGATRPPEDFFAELEDVCSQSRPVHRRLRFPGGSDLSLLETLFVSVWRCSSSLNILKVLRFRASPVQ